MILLIIIFFQLPDGKLHVIACDVGQGDGVLIVYKNIQIVTDGGPNNKIMDCLGKYIPFWDREIELVVSTHPDVDHSTGLIEVVRRYKVDNFLYNRFDVSNETYQVLEKEVGSRGIHTITPDRGKGIRLDLIYLDILHPSEGFHSKLTNEYSIIYELKYGNFEAIFTGDISPKISDEVSEIVQKGYIDYIKIPHHGSRNGLTENLLKVLEPKIAVISVGKKNRYGHPHKEILDMLNKYDVRVFRTDEMGDTEVVSDGKAFWVVE